MQVDGAGAGLLGVQVDLPGLAQRVGLDEVPLVVDVEAVVGGVVLEVGDEPGDVDRGHGRAVIVPRCRPVWTPPRSRLLDEAAAAIGLDARPARRLGPGRHQGRAVPQRPRRRRRGARRARAGGRRRALRGVGPPLAGASRHRGRRPARRLDQRQPRHPVVRHEPVRRRRRGPARRARRQPGVGRSVQRGARARAPSAGGRPLAPSDRHRAGVVAGRPLGHARRGGLAGSSTGRSEPPPSTCARWRAASSTPTSTAPSAPTDRGTTSAACSCAPRPAPSWTTPRAATSWCSSTTPAARRSRRPRASSSTRCWRRAARSDALG